MGGDLAAIGFCCTQTLSPLRDAGLRFFVGIVSGLVARIKLQLTPWEYGIKVSTDYERGIVFGFKSLA